MGKVRLEMEEKLSKGINNRIGIVYKFEVDE